MIGNLVLDNGIQEIPKYQYRVGMGNTGNFHGKAHICLGTALHEQVELLEDHADGPPLGDELLPAHGAQVRPVDEHLPGGGPLQQVDAPHQGGLARAAHAHNAVHLAVADGEGHVGQGVKLSLGGGKHLGDVFQFNHGILPSLPGFLIMAFIVC